MGGWSVELRARWTVALRFTPDPGLFGSAPAPTGPTLPQASHRSVEHASLHLNMHSTSEGQQGGSTKGLKMRETSPSKRPDQLWADMKVEAVFRAGESYSERRTGFLGAPRSSA